MKMVIGGAFQGKLNYALTLTEHKEDVVIKGETCLIDEVFEKPVVHNFQKVMQRVIEEERNLVSFIDLLLKSNPDVLLVIDEIGCGIVPVDADERKIREEIGRACCVLAGKAEEVHRVICGIGTKIKG